MNVAERILQEIDKCFSALPAAPENLWLAFSGGLDSSVLLHVVSGARQLFAEHQPLSIKAIHINHQLSEHADQWQAQCEAFALAHQVELKVCRVNVEVKRDGLENAARRARYQVFDEILQANDVLLTGHHANDQTETIVFRLLRGTGLRGLKGIASMRSLGRAHIARPMLGISRADIEEFAQQAGLSWVEDDSNENMDFDRNYLRRQILPRLSQRWPDIVSKVQRTAQWLTEADSLLQEYAEQDLKTCNCRHERLGQSLDLGLFMAYSDLRKKHMLRYWVELLGFSSPVAKHWGEIDKLLLSQEEASPLVAWGACELRRYRKRLYLLPRLQKHKHKVLSWFAGDTLRLPDGAQLRSQAPLEQHFTVRFRQGGERCRPQQRQHSQTLKKLLQEYALEPWLRDRVPLIFFGEQLVAVGDLFLCDDNPSLSGFEWCYPQDL